MLPSRNSDSAMPTAFTMPVDYAIDTTTGISAHDRAVTVRALINPAALPEDFIQPGHLFPLRYTHRRRSGSSGSHRSDC